MKEKEIPAVKTNPEDEKLQEFSVRLKAKLINDLKTMEKNSKKSTDELVATAVSYFIATHNDYLGVRR